jgi:hypothetical protein
MANATDLRPNPIFIAKEIYDYDLIPNHRVVVGKENGCSYYTNVVIIEGNPEEIEDKDINRLKKALSAALEKLDRKGE